MTATEVVVCVAKGVAFLEPLKLQEPQDDHEITFPFKSETETKAKS